MARVTIGIPFYNCQATLPDTIRSVFAQSLQDWELILLDDGSTDDSLSIARSVPDGRIRVVSDGVNKGIGARRRQIVDMAATDYLAWQDADDLMHPDRLTTQLQFLEQNPSIGLVDNWTYLIDTDNRVVGLRRLPPPDITLRDVVRGPVILNGSSLGRMQLYRDHPFDPTLRRTEDWEMWIRAFQSYSFGRIHEPLYFRRCVQSEGGRTFELKEFRNLKYVRRILLKHGPRLIGWDQTLLAMAEFHARFVVRTALSLLRLQRLRPQSRQTSMTDQERAEAEDILERILGVHVPGLGPAADVGRA